MQLAIPTLGTVLGWFSLVPGSNLPVAVPLGGTGSHAELLGVDLLLATWRLALQTTNAGDAEQEAPIYIFVAIVPVTMDAYFKLWIFRGLNSRNPAAAVTLKSMDRH